MITIGGCIHMCKNYYFSYTLNIPLTLIDCVLVICDIMLCYFNHKIKQMFKENKNT